MLRAVVGVNVLVSALLKHDTAPGRVMQSWQAGTFELVVSKQVISELARVGARPSLVRRLDPLALDALIRALRADALILEDPPTRDRVVARDPADDYLVALARAAEAHVIVTGDRHLLDLEGLRPPALDPRRFVELLERTG